MTDLDSLALRSPVLLDDLLSWMDGGSVTLHLLDSKGTAFSVEFCQTMFLQKQSYGNTPGSFLLDGQDVPIRSDSERALLELLRNVSFKETLPAEQQTATRIWIQELADFVESDEYLRIATLMGRWPV